MRYDIDNGISLCRKCHVDFHTQFGFKKNDGEQILEYLSEVSADPWYAGETFD
ncbi:hypothetical protein ABIC55_003603 [Sporosarcina psychrophila]|uniref:HNH domain-containing protein n=2 Tax=Sporosarcina psychrophila TaxID=1476 RepID=A0ABV2KBM4_SPOPS